MDQNMLVRAAAGVLALIVLSAIVLRRKQNS